MHPHSATIPEQDPLFLAWLAGFVDGEGCIYVNRCIDRRCAGSQLPLFHLGLTIANTVRAPLDEVQERLQCGQVYAKRTSEARGNWQPGYHYMAWGEAVKEICRLILPYLRIKHAEAELALSFPAAVHVGERRTLDVVTAQAAIFEELQAMKGRVGKRGRPRTSESSNLLGI